MNSRSDSAIHIHVSICVCWVASVLCNRVALWDPLDCGPPDFSVHGILQARILEWVCFWSRDRTHVSCIGRWGFYHWSHLGNPYMNHSPLNSLPIPAATQHWAEFSVLFRRSLWMVMFWSFSFLYVTWRYKFLPCLIHRMFSRIKWKGYKTALQT